MSETSSQASTVPKIADIMQTEVEVLRPDTTLYEAIVVLSECGISGAPVLTDEGQLVGIISEFALMDVLFDTKLKQARVSEYMTAEVHCLAETDSLTHAVHMFAVYEVRRLPVMRGNQLVGIVSRRDLMRYCLQLDRALATPLHEFMPELLESSTNTAAS